MYTYEYNVTNYKIISPDGDLVCVVRGWHQVESLLRHLNRC